jgi:hypothetical protein
MEGRSNEVIFGFGLVRAGSGWVGLGWVGLGWVWLGWLKTGETDWRLLIADE